MKTMLVHKTDILRNVASKDPVTRATKMTRTKINSDPVPCYLSQKQKGTMNATQETGPNRIEYTATVFFKPGTDVLVGDVLNLTLLGHTVRLKAGEPYRYREHTEVPVRRDEAEA